MKKILINDNPWQTRVALMRNNDLQNIYFSTHTQEILERSYFKGIVTKVLPGIQTAFVDIGKEKSGFLHISEIDRELAIENMSKHAQVEYDETSKKKTQRQKPNIAKIVKEGDAILVQVSKEPVYEKGAKLTTCFTLPGRFFVLTPNIPRLGVSKKIADREERIRLKDIVRKLLPEGMGGIIRTTSEARAAKEIAKDIRYLLKTWNIIQKKYQSAQPKEKIHEDLTLALQVVRDHLDDDVQAVITDNARNQKELYNFVKTIAPEHAMKVMLYDKTAPIFKEYGVESQITLALEKKVPLKSGGSLIIETTEAMTVIDVNTGRFTGKTNLEDTILKTNIEAAQEAAHQLRLRNIGGLIVIDFIDMAVPGNRQKLFNFLEKILREQDKFQSVVLKVSEFGLVQMTRKRSGKTLIQQLTTTCSNCHGLGFISSIQTDSFSVLRALKEELALIKRQKEVTVCINQAIFQYLASVEYNAILALEKEFKVKITLVTDTTLKTNQYKLKKK
jgi:ribonuclease G